MHTRAGCERTIRTHFFKAEKLQSGEKQSGETQSGETQSGETQSCKATENFSLHGNSTEKKKKKKKKYILPHMHMYTLYTRAYCESVPSTFRMGNLLCRAPSGLHVCNPVTAFVTSPFAPLR
ncbi:hypothetical protein POVWA2_006780 [Plasmodium ovale wallikeri]|uniref:Uncharacterized protein n=1 Tax=Plasmodium ovale wallikeri TaxID=864142 RepID=A0A1A8YK33_PLAOA|nr:hypothetical protein POVWA2_006780 [Plasmodium ovale wallikeri]